ncbi:MAG: M23 family metallopeptidase [archaeon]|nr:M23 family metallopeptidase [archaeon]
MVRPRTVVDLCMLQINSKRVKSVGIHSDVSDVSIVSGFSEAADTLAIERAYRFPLQSGAPVLCTQGHRGHFTHFNPCTRHAIDLQCPVGTPVVALGNGRVVEVADGNTVSGIDVRNLYSWNSLMLELDDGMYVEYVHIKPASAVVKKGERVAAGQVICSSGDIGFCPAPHLHIQMHRSPEKNAVTIPFAFLDRHGSPYVPSAGNYYEEAGPVVVVVSETASSSPSDGVINLSAE